MKTKVLADSQICISALLMYFLSLQGISIIKNIYEVSLYNKKIQISVLIYLPSLQDISIINKRHVLR